MKKLFSILAPLLVSLFLYPSIVSADTFNLSLSQTDITWFNNYDWENTLNAVNNKMNTDNYVYALGILNYGSPNTVIFYLYSTTPTVSLQYWGSGDNRLNLVFSGTRTEVYYINGSLYTGNTYSSTLYINIHWENNYLTYKDYYSSNPFIYSSSPISYNLNNPILNISYNNNTIVVENGTFIPSLYEIMTYSPTPSDNTPLLTQFFTISIEKLQTICDFIVSSYIYLAVIVIFLIYCSIYLLRRLK